MSSMSHPSIMELAQLSQYLPTKAYSHAPIEGPGRPAFLACEITDEPVIAKEEKDEAPCIRGWPTEPRPLKSFSFSSVILSIGEVLLALTPLAFIALGIAAAVLHRQPTQGNSVGLRVEQATRLGPTIFPILFAAVAGRTLKIIARFRAERGAKLGNLELLMASQTVWSTFESQVLLQRLTVVGAYLIILWSLSPLGGQACLRLLERGKHATVGSSKLRYLSTGANSIWSSPYGIPSEWTSAGPTTNSIYAASLLAPPSIMAGPQDTWGNVKIPRLETLQPSTRNSSGWMEVPSFTSPDNYTSLVGIPVVGIPQGLSTTFVLESSYVNLSCRNPLNFSLQSDLDAWSQQLGQLWSDRKPNSTKLDMFFNQDRCSDWTSFFMDTNLPFDNVARQNSSLGLPITDYGDYAAFSQPRHIVYASTYGPSGSLNLFNCTVGQTHVESLVRCTNEGACAVAKMRPSQADSRPWFLTPFDYNGIAASLFRQLPFAAGGGVGGNNFPTEFVLSNTSNTPYAPLYGARGNRNVDLGKLPGNLFGIRLALVLNTYYQISLAPQYYTGGSPTELGVYGPDVITPMWDNFAREVRANAPFVAGTTTASTTQEFEIYICNYLWLALLLVSSCVLLLVSVAGIIIKTRSLAPDMMGFVASLTYDNPYVVLPEGGATLDGMERAKLLRDLRVRIGDVRQKYGVGHIAFAAVGTTDVGGLEMRRMYK